MDMSLVSRVQKGASALQSEEGGRGIFSDAKEGAIDLMLNG